VPIPGALATVYTLKGDRFPAGSSEGRQWYNNALPVLFRADEIARVQEKLFDNAQSAHGKPLLPRRPSQMLYLLSGNTHASLGNLPEALAAYRYGRGIEPSFRPLYDREAAARRTSGDLSGAARVELQKAFALGLAPDLITDVGRAYAALPDGGCATVRSGGIPMLNAECPRVREDVCSAVAEVAATFAEARKAEQSRSFTRMAAQYGCAIAR